MKQYQTSLLLLFFIFAHSAATAQISPGDLSKAHAQLEGISNCTKCHVFGEKITNDKCLACHTEIKDLQNKKKGYHSSGNALNNKCTSCHSDHHGRNYKIINFNKETFNHKETGYELLGKHKEQECSKCHKAEFTRTKISQKKEFTWLGLENNCLNCHQDYHQKTLSPDCAVCHDFNSFKLAPLFDHQKTKFPLTGKHTKVDCNKCHKLQISQNKEFRQFADVPFTNCTNCHKDVHNNQFGQNCRKCHNEDSFQKVATTAFDHNKTNYPLTGKHLVISCNSCHRTGYSTGLMHNLCSDCHADFHKNQFKQEDKSPDCAACHTTSGFSPSNFSVERHNQTSFKLDGQHLSVNCGSCHKKVNEWIFKDLTSACKDCHVDYHEKEFTKEGQSPDCSNCHNTRSFASTTYSVEKHNETGFMLEGAHLATPCFACHKENRWKFRGIGQNCTNCHENIHKNTIENKYWPDHDCRNCHNVKKWNDVSFDHSRTGFPLLDKHAVLSCAQCHKTKNSFDGLTKNCLNCHKDIHIHQFDDKETCTRCHDFKDWKAGLFNHDNTNFKLGLSHRNVACDKCHYKENSPTGTYVKYKITKIKCADCHS